MMQPLTKRQREILTFIVKFIAAEGYAPSLEEIGRAFGLTSLATVYKHLTNLQDKRYIVRAWNRSRSITVIPQALDGCCPMCGAKTNTNLAITEVAKGDSIKAVEFGMTVPPST